MLDPKLLNILACPKCKVDVIYRRVGNKEELICGKCKRIFEVKDGIPLMLPTK
jgi:uncharacterized protein YbaR (Trm112 family)